MTIPFFELATATNIVLFRLPAHFTHLTQPLDVGVFQSFKHYHTEAIDRAVRLGDIRHAFKSTGIVPFNPNVVLDKIREKEAQLRESAI